MTLEDQIRALLEAKQNKDQDQDDQQKHADRVDDEPAVKIENPMDPNLSSSEISPQEEIANAEMQGQVNKQNVQEYFVRGTVNGKKFQSVTDDAYSADQIKAQNPHLTDDEAKAVQNHTESDEFTNGDEYTSSNQNGHKVIVHTNGGYQGDVTHTLNKIGVDEAVRGVIKTSTGFAKPQTQGERDHVASMIKTNRTVNRAKNVTDTDGNKVHDDDKKGASSATHPKSNDSSRGAYQGSAGTAHAIHEEIQVGDTVHHTDVRPGKLGVRRGTVKALDGDHAHVQFDDNPHDHEVVQKHWLRTNAEVNRSNRVQESISDLLGDEFSEEFKVKAQTIFEAAVKDQVMKFEAKLQEEQNAAVAKLQEEFDEKFEQMKNHLEEETSDKIDGYLSHLAEEWKKDNEIALEAAIKSELTESFINNLKAVFEQHYIDLPEDKVDLYHKTLEEKAEMENALASTVSNLAKLTEELNHLKREQIIEESLKEFSSLDAARFKTLTEDFGFEDEESFKTKLSIVKKSFFGQKSTASEQLAEEIVKTPEIVETTSNVNVITENTAMSSYLRALKSKK